MGQRVPTVRLMTDFRDSNWTKARESWGNRSLSAAGVDFQPVQVS